MQDTFWTRVAVGEGCWTYGKQLGYGTFRGKRAHRVSWEMTYGPIPEGMNVCHRCDNPPCVRPDHLFLGTQSENMQDASKKKRLGAAPLPLTITEAAAVLGLKPATLRTQIRLGRLEAVKLARDWFIDPVEVERYRKENRREG